MPLFQSKNGKNGSRMPHKSILDASASELEPGIPNSPDSLAFSICPSSLAFLLYRDILAFQALKRGISMLPWRAIVLRNESWKLTLPRIVSVTRHPFKDLTLCSSQFLSVDAAVKSRLSATTGVASLAYSRSMEIPQNFSLMTGTYESSTADSSVTSGWFCRVGKASRTACHSLRRAIASTSAVLRTL